jgi:hypothetical protein
MKTTNSRCVALTGKVGCEVGCSIYNNRPNACRAFVPGSTCAVRRGRRRELFKEDKTMFAFNPGVNDTSGQILGQGMVSSAQTKADAQVKMVDDIGGAKDKKKLLDGMDKSVSAMSDMGAITTDFRDKYMAVDQDVRPFLFEAIASPMFKSYTAGQSAAAQAQAWDKYKQNWGGGGGGGQPGGGWTVY